MTKCPHYSYTKNGTCNQRSEYCDCHGELPESGGFEELCKEIGLDRYHHIFKRFWDAALASIQRAESGDFKEWWEKYIGDRHTELFTFETAMAAYNAALASTDREKVALEVTNDIANKFRKDGIWPVPLSLIHQELQSRIAGRGKK